MSDDYGILRADLARPSRFVVGRDGNGHWVVWDRRALCGGSFVNREDAIRYARFESEGMPGDVAFSNDVVHFEVTLGRAPGGLGPHAEGNETSNAEQVGDAPGRRKAA